MQQAVKKKTQTVTSVVSNATAKNCKTAEETGALRAEQN